MKPADKKKIACACSMLGNPHKCRKVILAMRLLHKGQSIFGASELTFADANHSDHPNAMPFTGTLLLVDTPSDKPPHGSRGHRILVPAKVAERVGNTLIGMGVNYDPGDLNEHLPRHKVGVINKAWLEGKKFKVSGVIYKKDFPETERDLKRGGLGMSMELANVFVKDENDPVWILQDFSFTGATILKRDAAAYTSTSLAAMSGSPGEGDAMPKPNGKKTVAAAGSNSDDPNQALVAAITTAFETATRPLTTAFKTLGSNFEVLASSVKEQNGLLTMMAAGQTPTDEDEDVEVNAGADDDEDMDAAKHDDDDDDDMDAASKKKQDDSEDDGDDEEDDGDDDELDAALEDLEEKKAYAEPGQVNKNMKKKGSKTTTTDVGAEAMTQPLVRASAARDISAAAVIQSMRASFNKKLHSIKAAAQVENKKLRRQMGAMQAQVERYAEMEDRRSVASIPVELHNIAAKANIDLRDVQLSGAKLTTDQVDSMFAASGIELDPVQRMAMKNRLLEGGLMDQGQIVRNTM